MQIGRAGGILTGLEPSDTLWPSGIYHFTLSL